MKAEMSKVSLGLNHCNERLGLISKRVLFSSLDLVKNAVNRSVKFTIDHCLIGESRL